MIHMQKEPNHQQSRLQSLGINLDPMSQLTGLVNLINQSQAPGIQQQQHQDEMDFRQLMGEEEMRMGQAQFDQRAKNDVNQQANADRTYGLQRQEFQDQEAFRTQTSLDKAAALRGAAADRANTNAMDFDQLIMNIMADPRGAGMIDPNVAAAYMEKRGFGKLINPVQQGSAIPYDTSKTMVEGDPNAFRASYQKHTGR